MAAVAVLLAAASLAVLEAAPLRELFLRAAPTRNGSFSLLDARPLFSFASHLALAVIALHRLIASETAARATRSSARVCYGALALELLSLAPCVLAGGALCGVFYVLLLPATSLAILVGFAAYLAASRSRALVAGASAALGILAASALAAWWILTPRSPAECERIGESIGRDNCVARFALRSGDAALCDRVEFDSARWTCLYELAGREGDPSLCEQIALPCRHRSPGPICTPDPYRDTCFLVVARKRHDPGLCARVSGEALRTRCLEQTR